jgi:hypothetical protein
MDIASQENHEFLYTILRMSVVVKHNIIKIVLPLKVDRDSSVGIATRYGLDGPGIKSRWGARFSALVQTGSGVNPAFHTVGTSSFPGVKQTGHGIDHPRHLALRLKKEQSYTSTPPLDLCGLF